MDLAVDVVRANQFVVRAIGGDATIVEHDDAIGEGNRREAVGDDQRRPTLHDLLERAANAALRGGIDGGRGVVEDQDARIEQQRAGNRDALALATREGQAALAHESLVAIGQLFDKRRRLCTLGRLAYLSVRRLGLAEGDVVADRGGEEVGVLGDDADRAAQLIELQVAYIDALDEDRALLDVVEARHELRQRRLARAGAADDRDGRAGRDVEVDTRHDWTVPVVAKGDVVEVDRATTGRKRLGVGCIDNLGFGIENREDADRARHKALGLADPHAEHPQRHHHQRDQEAVGDEVAEAHRALDDLAATDEHQERDRDCRQKVHDRHVLRAQSRGRHVERKDVGGAVAKARHLFVFLAEGLDHTHADDGLLGLRRHMGERLLGLRHDRLRAARIHHGEHAERRHDHQHEQRDERIHPQQHGHHGHDGDGVLRKEEDAVAEKQAQCRQVDSCATHDLPGLIAVVERKRQRQQVVIDEVAQVLLDVDRHRAGDQASEVHDGEAPDGEAENQDDQIAQLVGVAWPHRLVDDATSRPRNRDREDLTDHGQHD